MAKLPKKAIKRLCEELEVDPHFFAVCLEESIIEITEINGRLDLQNGTVLSLRRLQRLCITFSIDVHLALMLARK